MRISRAILNATILIGLAGCANQEKEDVPVDELHRPQPWSTTIIAHLNTGSGIDGGERFTLNEVTLTQDVEVFLDALFHLAFSGDARVFAPDVLGELDRQKQLSPEQLFEHLRQVDTVSVEDIFTGEIRDTIIDLSFNRSSCSAITIFFSCSSSESSEAMTPYALALGSKVYNESTGEFRGVLHKFFIELEHGDLSESSSYQQLTFLSDSLGVMKPTFIERYDDSARSGICILDQFEDKPIKLQIQFMDAEQRLLLSIEENQAL